MKEIVITTNKMNHLIDPSLHVWGWEISVYLFLGGLTAGILIISASMTLLDKGSEYSFSKKLSIAGPVVLSIGMFAIFLDLEEKLYAWRFYTAFNVSAPMSWGAWIVLFVYPLNILLIFTSLREGFPVLHGWLKSGNRVLDWSIEKSEEYRRPIAGMNIVMGLLLGIYTGVLLSAYGARPFWNSAVLGPIFLVSGISTAAALVLILSGSRKEQHLFTRVDILLILTELSLLVLLIIGLLTSTSQHMEAAGLILGGELTVFFWVFIFGLGLSVPAVIESIELAGRKLPRLVAPLLVLIGGLLLRIFMVEAGQLSSWIKW